MSKSQKDQRANQMNPDNSAHKSAGDNRSNQMNPNNPASNQESSGSGRWSERMDERSASRIQAHADKTGTNQDFKSRAQSAADKNADDSS